MGTKTIDSFETDNWRHAKVTTTVNKIDVTSFIAASGDSNPIHWNKPFASKTRFDEPIVHGALLESYISAAVAELANDDECLVLMNKKIEYKAPVPVGSNVCAHAAMRKGRGSKYSIEFVLEVLTELDPAENKGKALDTVEAIRGTCTVLIDSVK